MKVGVKQQKKDLCRRKICVHSTRIEKFNLNDWPSPAIGFPGLSGKGAAGGGDVRKTTFPSVLIAPPTGRTYKYSHFRREQETS